MLTEAKSLSETRADSLRRAAGTNGSVPGRAAEHRARAGFRLGSFLRGSLLRAAIGFSTLLGAWQAAVSIGWINPLLLPAPLVLVETFGEMIRDGTLARHVAASLERVLVGFGLATAVGLVTGVLLGWFRAVAEFVRPLIEALRPIPPIAWTPVAILWFGIGDAPSYFLVFIGAVFPVFVNTYAAVCNIGRSQINAALCLGAGPWMLICDVLIPASLPVIFPGLRIALGVGWMCVVAAELIAAQSGLGYMIQQSRVLLQTQQVVCGMIAIGIIGFAMNSLMSIAERWLIPWKESDQ